MKRPMTLLMALMMTTTALFAGVTADDHGDDTGGASWGADALMFAQDHIDAYSDSNHSQPAFDLATAFNLTVASDGENVTGGLGGNWTDECDMNWPSDSYHIAVYSFVAEYVLNLGASVGCFLESSDLDQTYQSLAYELEDGWHAHVGNSDHGGFGMTEEEAHAFFNNTDADGNGNVTVEEFEAAYCPDGCDEETSQNISIVFSVIDTDGDGNVTWDEWRAYVVEGDQGDGMSPEYLMALFDGDDDGYVTHQEMIDAMTAMASDGEIDDSMLAIWGSIFNASDEDGDGCDVDELWAFWETLMEMSGPSLEELFDIMDLNEDGFLDYQEVIDAINAGNEADGEPLLGDDEKAGIQQIFDDSDIDADGLISSDEFEAFWDALGYGGEDDGASPDVMFALCNADGDDYLMSAEILDCLNDMRESDGEPAMSPEEENYIQGIFDDSDDDMDGLLDHQEFEAFWDALTHEGDGGDGDMVCYDIDSHTIVPDFENQDDCENAGYMWVENSDDGGHGDDGCPFANEEFCMDISDICDSESSTYNGTTCGLEMAHWCADNNDPNGEYYDAACEDISDACEAGHMPADLCDAFTTFDHDSHHDSDGDGVHDEVDLCAGGDDYADSDNDGVPDACDDFPDEDADGVIDGDDLCEGNDDNIDVDGDGVPDGCDGLIDSDGDNVGDDEDDFPNDANESADSDGDGVGDNADDLPNDETETIDSDGDGVGDNADACEGHDDGMDQDNDGIIDGCDDLIDSDGDGVDDSTAGSSGDEDDDDDDKGRLPGFTLVVTLTAMMGALLLAGRRKA